MLYLIRTFGRGKHKTALKVGFSDNIDSRMGNYRVSNPFYEQITTREGTREEETLAHLYLNSLGLKERFLNEWFIDSNDVLQHFHDRVDKMEKRVWRFRDELFSESDFKPHGNQIKKELYESLAGKFKSDVSNSAIDNSWLKITNLNFLKESRKEYKSAMNRFK